MNIKSKCVNGNIPANLRVPCHCLLACPQIHTFPSIRALVSPICPFRSDSPSRWRSRAVRQLAKTPDSGCKCACRKRRGDIPSSPSFSILPSFSFFLCSPPCLSLNRKPLAYYAHLTQCPWENVPPTETSLLSPSSSSPSWPSSPPAFDLVRCQTRPRIGRR